MAHKSSHLALRQTIKGLVWNSCFEWWPLYALLLLKKEKKMATALATAVNGLGLFVSTLLSLRDQRFLATVEAVTSAVTCMTMSLTLCFLAIHRHARVEAGPLFV
ncbi:hypothetical protein OIU74_024028 [Salix koriyanagi]|uniref:Uncharacterized protein n=1 Tax=Salix koriyanagi TaxID=2511006 RepID=A0A9Q0WGL6_9ROSI|nr:hypothetical protein OIU74_024028 [Salix koriyanagi]